MQDTFVEKIERKTTIPKMQFGERYDVAIDSGRATSSPELDPSSSVYILGGRSFDFMLINHFTVKWLQIENRGTVRFLLNDSKNKKTGPSTACHHARPAGET
ncbi:hypothetical protein Q5P01_002665 [Channa striata]|uniref:Uncharacterized protein n=1 Tax=Channa striata TaxID=64152 RepID=A0AA88T505_CHASR|nr:hypothetical protein Q5P01_002665 [Channa striata]